MKVNINNNLLYILMTITNIISLICFTLLAIYFNCIFIVLGALLFRVQVVDTNKEKEQNVK